MAGSSDYLQLFAEGAMASLDEINDEFVLTTIDRFRVPVPATILEDLVALGLIEPDGGVYRATAEGVMEAKQDRPVFLSNLRLV